MTKGRTIEADRTASDSFGQVDQRLCIVSVAFNVSETGYSIHPLIPLKKWNNKHAYMSQHFFGVLA